ncbi:tRNA methyltransferase 10 homolog B [Strongylocentrotus purpuratus]|uniref:tRNA methyltransferase 10 homolog B n=1 Tax=Strongylocentrotus purpuratus TaxID=7668 RepID=A0A7M7LIL8_STRPU|nr:tRNA methyltransferase 10 homolog B [Strongylocentrotus purpuratus]|eukprot:XP_001183487.2 PREDICTED: tRNA methyltransferase 10 homolog B isoform X1 [Strongylocentrotus purpuratus]
MESVSPSPAEEQRSKLTRKERAAMRRQRLVAVNDDREGSVPRLCIDLSLGHLMSEKEIGGLVCQIRQVYGANRQADRPMQVWLTSLDTEGSIYKASLRKNDGFEHYVMNKTSQHYSAIFSQEEIVYLTPDSPNVLTEIQDSKVYIIGGLVDESVLTNMTFDLAKKRSFHTAKLPISRCMKHAERGTFSQVLAINQVFDILLRYYNTGNWESSVVAVMPKRKGFIPK